MVWATFHPHYLQIRRGREWGRDKTVLYLRLLCFLFLLSKRCCSRLRIFSPFSFSSYPAMSLLGFWLLLERGDHISTILFRAFSHREATASLRTPPQNVTSRITRKHMLTCRHTLRTAEFSSLIRNRSQMKSLASSSVENWVMVLLLAETDRQVKRKMESKCPYVGECVWARAVALCVSITSACKSIQTNLGLIK